MRVLLLLAGLLPLRAQEAPSDLSGLEPVSSSTPAATEAARAPAPPPPRPRQRVVVHKEAAQWEPVSVVLRPGSGPRRSFCERHLRKVGKGYKGLWGRAAAVARLHPAGEDRWLVVAVYPEALRRGRMHLEARFFLQEGYLEAVKLAAVRVVGDKASADDAGEDSFTLRAKGVDFVERFPAAAEVELSAVDPRGRNAGVARFAAFGGTDLGFVHFGWAIDDVRVAPRVRPGAARRRP